MSPKNLKSLIKTMRTNGVLKLEFEGIKLELAPESLFPNKNGSPDSTPLNKIKMPRPMSDLEIALWSAKPPEEQMFEGEEPTTPEQ